MSTLHRLSDDRRIREALQRAALAASSAVGDQVFQELARFLCTILDADLAFVGMLAPGEPPRLKALGIHGDDSWTENMEYLLDSTPCRSVVGSACRIISGTVQQQFPDLTLLARRGFQSYAGYPLNDSAGRPLGVLAVLARRPFEDAALIQPVLEIFAGRASAEIARRTAEEALRVSEQSYRAIFEAAEDSIFIHDWIPGRSWT